MTEDGCVVNLEMPCCWAIGDIFPVSASISMIGSTAIIWHILRSHKGLSSTYHRLVFGLCVGDLMSSLAFAVNTKAVPKELQYIMPSARGNVGTCTAQGLLLTAGVVMASAYNCMICFYYLLIITYNKKDDYIKRKLEPWFHGVPIILAIVIGITGLIMKQFNTTGEGYCYLINYHPPHCEDVANGIIPDGFSILCGRGDTKSGNFFKLTIYLMPFIVPAIIVVTMVAMYRTVRRIERKMRNYGAGALRLRANQRQARVVDDPHGAPRGRDNHTSLSLCLCALKNKFVSICSCVLRNNPSQRSNNARSQKRAVLYMAMSYSLTWALTWIPFAIVFFVINNKTTEIFQVILQPLQGLYNLIVYMSPKVRHARNTRRGKLPWSKAIAKAWKSKGEKDRAIVGRRHNNTSSLLQRLQSRLSIFMERMSNRFSALTSSSKSRSVPSSAMQPPLTEKQTEEPNNDRENSHPE